MINTIFFDELYKQYSWYDSVFTPVGKDCSSEFFYDGFEYKLASISTNMNVLSQNETFFVTKVKINSKNDVYNYGGAISVKGGTYKFEPDFLAEGYESVQNADNTWTVVKTQPDNEIWYTSYEMKLEPTDPNALNATIISNEWDKTTGKGVITFDAPLTTIGENAFKRITNTTPSNWVTSISLPNSIITIGNYAFYMCYSLKNITIPASVESMGEYALGTCYDLKTIISKSHIPPTLVSTSLYNLELENVIVPASAVEAYKTADYWNQFNIVAE